jgi:hypothetical protein
VYEMCNRSSRAARPFCRCIPSARHRRNQLVPSCLQLRIRRLADVVAAGAAALRPACLNSRPCFLLPARSEERLAVPHRSARPLVRSCSRLAVVVLPPGWESSYATPSLPPKSRDRAFADVIAFCQLLERSTVRPPPPCFLLLLRGRVGARIDHRLWYCCRWL